MDETEADETARAQQAAQVILDGVEAEPADGEDGVSDAMQVAFARLVEIGAIEIAVEEPDADDGELEFELDISPLLGGIQLVIGHLVDEVSRQGGISREDVLAAAREALARP